MTSSEIELVLPEVDDSIPSLDSIPRFNLEGMDGFDGPPVFIGTLDDVCKIVEAHGINFYFVIGMEEYKNEKNVLATRPQIFKVMNSHAFHYVQPVQNAIKLDKIKPSVTLTLPLMPYELITKIEQFFRKVHDKLDTEATVILTYDNAFKNTGSPSDGWGVLIPKQENTAMACEYKPESIATLIPNNTTYVVGTVHSHPEMPAYASGTDHKDQSAEDGLHITIGWQPPGNHTEYHIGLAVGGEEWTLQPSQVFAPAPKPPEYEGIDAWMEEVTKKTVTLYSSGGSHFPSSGTSHYNTTGSTGPKEKLEPMFYPTDAPSLEDNYIIGVAPKDDTSVAAQCPFCEIIMTSTEHTIENHCVLCDQLVLPAAVSNIDEIAKLPKESDLKSIGTTPPKNVYIWTPKELTEEKKDRFDLIYTGKALEVVGEPPKA